MLWEQELTGYCFHSFFKFSQTFTEFLGKSVTKKRKQPVNFDHQNVNSLYFQVPSLRQQLTLILYLYQVI